MKPVIVIDENCTGCKGFDGTPNAFDYERALASIDKRVDFTPEQRAQALEYVNREREKHYER